LSISVEMFYLITFLYLIHYTLDVLKQLDEEYDRVYKSFYKHIKSCSSAYAKPLKHRKRVLIN